MILRVPSRVSGVSAIPATSMVQVLVPGIPRVRGVPVPRISPPRTGVPSVVPVVIVVTGAVGVHRAVAIVVQIVDAAGSRH